MPHREAMVGIAGGGFSTDAAEPLTPLGSLARACSPTRGERWAVPLLAFSLTLAAFIAPAQADKVGVAAAVNPDAFSSLSGTPSQQLNIGKSIFYNERVSTTNSGLVQVLLVDGSTFTVGPNSDLVIDKFVYDPNKKTGQVVATFSKGAMRFVGGKISKNEGGVSVKTPAGALAIRGGMFQASVNGTKIKASFLYGVSLSFSGYNGVKKDVFQQGYTLDLSSGTPVVRPTTQEDVQFFAKAFSGGGTVVVGGQGTQPAGNNNQSTLVDTVSLQDLISDATATQIDSTLTKEEEDTPIDPTNPNTNTNTNTNNNNNNNNGGTDPGTPVTVRVLNTPGVYSAYGSTYEPGGDSGILGGGNYGDTEPTVPVVDDFIWTFHIKNNRLIGTVTGLLDASCSGGDCQMIETHTISEAKVNFPTVFPAAQCENGVCAVLDAKITQNGETRTLIGRAVLKQDFFAYHLAEQDDNGNRSEPLLVFGGKAHQFDAPSGKVHLFALTPDVLQDGAAPFASSNSTPGPGGESAISPLILLEQDGGAEDQSRPVWLQTSFAVGGGASAGESFINIALGEWSFDGGLSGERRGGADLNIYPDYYPGQSCDGQCLSTHDTYNPGPSQDSFSFTGDIASLAGPDGSHFLGTGENPNLVAGFDSTGSHNIGRDTPLNPNETNNTVENQSGSTYHIGVGIGSPGELQQTSSDYEGYAAGFVQQSGNGAPETLLNTSPNGVTLSLNADTNTMTASIHVGDGQIGPLFPNPRYDLEFGGGEGNSAFIDDGIFAAFENEEASGIEEDERYGPFGIFKRTHTYETDVQGYFVSADAINANAVLFPGQTVEGPDGPVQKRAFCQDCNFIKWGAWGARLGYTDYKGQPVTEDVHLGWWIAGDVVSSSDMPTTGEAYYAGDAIGTVASKQNGSWNQYVATGDMNMNWDFAKRLGLLKIIDFDNKNLSGLMVAPGRVNFDGPLGNAKAGIIGSASGSFVGPNGGAAPKGVIGNFGVGNIQNTWKANGIFGGTHVPRQ